MKVFSKENMLMLSMDKKTVNVLPISSTTLLIKYQIDSHINDFSFAIYDDDATYDIFCKLYDDIFSCANSENILPKDNSIISYSDMTSHEVANTLKIKKLDNTVVLNFGAQPHKMEYERDFNCRYGSKKFILIKLNESNSFYLPFLNMYNSIKNLNNKVMIKK